MTGPVVVIGGGLAGLAAAARLAKKGHPVELFESTPSLGGRWAAKALRPGTLVDRRRPCWAFRPRGETCSARAAARSRPS